MLFAHAGHSHGAEGMCCSTVALVVAGLALAVAVVALVVALKNKKK